MHENIERKICAHFLAYIKTHMCVSKDQLVTIKMNEWLIDLFVDSFLSVVIQVIIHHLSRINCVTRIIIFMIYHKITRWNRFLSCPVMCTVNPFNLIVCQERIKMIYLSINTHWHYLHWHELKNPAILNCHENGTSTLDKFMMMMLGWMLRHATRMLRIFSIHFTDLHLKSNNRHVYNGNPFKINR